MPRSSYYQAHKKELLEKQRERRKKKREEQRQKGEPTYEDILRQRKDERDRQDPWNDKEVTSGGNPW